MAAHRAIFPTDRAARLPEFPDCTKWWGPDRHILVYFMTSRRDEVYVIGVVPPRPDLRATAASLPSSRAELFQCFDGFHADLLRVIEVTADVTVWPIFDRERNDRWSGGRIVLLGDACHPMRPFMAAGGAMAIEDAAILSRCLAQFDEPAEAYRWYEATRIERVGESPAPVDREQLDARGDRHRLVLLLRSLHGAAPSTSLDEGIAPCWSRNPIR
jgi:6-hydroxynicotinate 3-monooxygenase